MCPNDTVFDQQHLVCTNWFEVDCRQAVQLFLNDFGHKKSAADAGQDNNNNNEDEYTYRDYDYYSFKDDDDDGQSNSQSNRFLANSSPASGGNRGAGRGQEQVRGGFRGQQNSNNNNVFRGNNNNNNNVGSSFVTRRPPVAQTAAPPPPSTTAIPVGIAGNSAAATTRRTRPRVKSDIRARKNNQGNKRNRFNGGGRNNIRGGGNRNTFDSQGRPQGNRFRQPQVRPDGRPPRVKSNLRGRNRNNGFRESPRTKLGNKVVGEPRDNIKFVKTTITTTTTSTASTATT